MINDYDNELLSKSLEKRNYRPDAQTNLIGTWSSSKIIEFLAPNWGEGTKVDVCIIGAGYEAGPRGFPFYVQPYEPYTIYEDLLLAGFDPNLVVVDVNPKILDLVKNRKNIFLSNSEYSQPAAIEQWEKLKNAGNGEETIHEMFPELDFLINNQIDPDNQSPKFQLELEGFRVTKVSQRFLEGLNNQKIKLINSDIVKFFTKDNNSQYRYISCLNVLMYLEPDSQKVVLTNLRKLLTKDGVMHFRDSKNLNKLLIQNGGWLDQSKSIKDFGVEFDSATFAGERDYLIKLANR